MSIHLLLGNDYVVVSEALKIKKIFKRIFQRIFTDSLKYYYFSFSTKSLFSTKCSTIHNLQSLFTFLCLHIYEPPQSLQ